MRFMEGYKLGDLDDEDIHDWITRWKGEDSDKTLYEYLGMTYREYVDWVDGVRTLRQIADDRRSLLPPPPGLLGRIVNWLLWKLLGL